MDLRVRVGARVRGRAAAPSASAAAAAAAAASVRPGLGQGPHRHGHHGRLLLLHVQVLHRAAVHELLPAVPLARGARPAREVQDVLLFDDGRPVGAHDEQGPARPPRVRVQPQLAQAHVVHDADLRVQVDLAPHAAQGGHQVRRVAVDAHPHPVDKHFRRARDDGGGHLLQRLQRPLIQKLQQRPGRAPDRHVRHQGQVLDQAARLALGRLRRADHAPLRVVQLAGLGGLPLPPDGRVDPAQVGERGRKGQAVQHLGHARPHVRRALDAPIAGGDRVPQAPRQRVLVDGGRQLDGFAPVQAALDVAPRVPHQLAEQGAEEAGQEGAAQVQALVGVVVPVVRAAAAQGHQQQAVDDVPKEVGLLGVRVGRDPDVGQQLLLQRFPGPGDAVRPQRARVGATLAQVVERCFLGLDGERLFERGAQRLQQLGVPEVGRDVLHDLPVRAQAQGAEDDHDRHVRVDVGQGGDDGRAAASTAAPAAAGLLQLDGQGGRRPGRALALGPHLGQEGVFAARGRLEDVDVVVGHALLRDQHLFGAVHNEVAALVKGALAQGRQVGLRRVRQGAVGGPQHDGDLPDVDFRVVFRLLIHLVLRRRLALAVRPAARAGGDDPGRLLNVHVQRGGVGQGAQAGLAREEGGRLAVRLGHGRAGQVDLAKAHRDLRLGRAGAAAARARALSRVVLVLRGDCEGAHLVHHFL